MKIQSRAKFTSTYLRYHYDFETDLTLEQIMLKVEELQKIMIAGLSKKCGKIWSTMYFFEMYIIDEKGKQINLFKKEKKS